MADDVQVTIGAQLEGLQEGVEEAKGLIEDMTSPISGVVGAFGEMAEAIATAFAIEKIGEFVKEMGELGEQTERTSKILGLSTEQVGELQYAFAMTGTSSENLSLMAGRLELSLERAASNGATPAAKGLQALGLEAKELIGIPFPEQMDKMADAVSRFADGTNKTAALQAISRGLVELIPLLDQGSAGFDKMREAADATNSVLDEPTTIELADMNHAFVDLRASINGVEQQAFIPFINVIRGAADIMSDVAKAFSSSAKEGGALNGALTLVADAFKTVVTVVEVAITEAGEFYTAWSTARNAVVDSFVGLGVVIKDVIVAIASGFENFLTGLIDAASKAVHAVGQYFVDLGSVVANGLTGHFSEASAAYANMGSDISSSSAGIKSALSGALSGFDLSQARRDAAAGVSGVEADFKAGGDKMVADTEQAMKRIRELWATPYKAGGAEGPEQNGAGLPQAGTMDLNASKGGAKQAAEAVKQGFAEEVQAAKDAEKSIETDLNDRLKLHQITMSQWLKQTDDALDAEALAIINAAEKAGNSAALSSAQKEAIWAKEAHDLQEIANQEANAQTKAAEESQKAWKSAADGIAGAINGQVDSLLRGTETIGQAFEKMAGSMIEDAIKLAIKSMAENAAVVAAHVAGSQTIAAADQAANASGLVSGLGGIMQAISSSIGAVIAGVSGFLAPIIGPAAPAAGIAAGAAVKAAAAVPGLDVGGYVLNSGLAQIHAGETITPANVVSPYNSSMGGGGSSPNITVNYTHNGMAQMSDIVANARQITQLIVQQMNSSPSLRPSY